ncbi:MAG: class I SAM-dependent methyltransferase [Planctomycetes bacterium]|nr:class I SAM-dependent methyltransferase [Planctomycetota bacterium]
MSPLPPGLQDLNAGIYGHAPSDPTPTRRLPRRHLRELAYLSRQKGSLLDVGCGAGRFLLAARERGWRVAGVDLSESNARAGQATGLDVRSAALADAGFEEQSFDAARLNQVIEHVPEPLDLLRDVAKVLRPGGLLSLATPNIASLSARFLGAQWNHLGSELNGHLVLFSRATLTRALVEAGFRPLRWKTIGLRLRPRSSGVRDRVTRLTARLLTPLAQAAGEGGRLHVFAERTELA